MNTKNKPLPDGANYDEADREGERLFKIYLSNNSDTESLSKAAELYQKSTHPEGKEIALTLRGLFKREIGINESDNGKGADFLHQAYIMLSEAAGVDSEITKRVRLEYLSRKIKSLEHNGQIPKELLLERANIYQEFGNTQNYHIDMSLYYMSSMLELDYFDTKQIDCANLMVEHAKESGNQNMFYKTRGLLHQVRSAMSPDLRVSVKELEESLNFIQQTTDRYGEEEMKAKLALAKGMITSHRSKREAFLHEAAQRSQKLGDRKQALAAIEMLLPIPVKVSVILQLADRSLDNHKLLGKRIQELVKITPGPYALFHHHSHLIERIKDVKRIIKRLGENRKELTNISIRENSIKPGKAKPGQPVSKKLQQLMSKHHELTEQMKLDMESLYIFGNLLLDQWSYIVGYSTGVNNPDFFNFHSLYDLMSSNKNKGLLSLFYDKHKKDIYWLYYQLRSYRNIFIEHVRRPWQRGNIMSVYGDDFNLFIPTPPGWLDDMQTKKSLAGIFHLAPKKLRDAPDDYWEKKNLHRVLEVTFMHIDEIEEKKDREKVWDVWKVVGGSTPSYDVIGYRLMNFVATSVSTLMDTISEDPGKINLGKTTSH